MDIEKIRAIEPILHVALSDLAGVGIPPLKIFHSGDCKSKGRRYIAARTQSKKEIWILVSAPDLEKKDMMTTLQETDRDVMDISFTLLGMDPGRWPRGVKINSMVIHVSDSLPPLHVNRQQMPRIVAYGPPMRFKELGVGYGATVGIPTKH